MVDNVPALLPDVRLPAMPTYTRFERWLRPGRWRNDGVVDCEVYIRDDQLIPVAMCDRIDAELQAASIPAPAPVAARLAKLLIGSYPARQANNAEIFVRMLTATLAEYPPDVGIKAVDELTRTSKWLPTRAELVEALEREMIDRRHAANVIAKHRQRWAEIEERRQLPPPKVPG